MNNKVNLYEKIIENRFKISIVSIVILTIIGFFMSDLKFYEWIVKTDITFCLWWNLKRGGIQAEIRTSKNCIS